MKIDEVRASFTVYLIASELERVQGIVESLRLSGYMVASFAELTAAFSEFPSNPPHMILFDAEEEKFHLKKAIKQVLQQLPESHILLITSPEARERSAALLEQGVYGLIYTPLVSPLELVKTLDHAAERDYFMYMNERLTEGAGATAAPEAPAAIVSSDDEEYSHFTRQLFAQKNVDDTVQVFLNATSQALGGCGAVFFRYILNRRVLLAADGCNLPNIDLSGIGVDFNQSESGFRSSNLREPKNIPEIQDMAREFFNAENFFVLPIEALGEVQGVALFLCEEPELSRLQVLRDWIHLLERSLTLLEAEKRLHVVTVKDPATDLLNRQNFIVKVGQEISRARRTSLPVCLALCAIDQYGQIVSQVGAEEAQTVLRMTARIFEKHSRVNDVIGRTGADEFGLILPHTSREGALIKVERLRRIVESADFSRVLRDFPHITISVGVSEYPSMVRDAEELIQFADEALFQVRSSGNKTCVAKPPDGFVADFQVREKGP